MAKLHLAALVALGTACIAAQPALAEVPIQPNVDTAAQRQALRELSACLANARPRWARQMLAKPYLSDAQAYDASAALSGGDRCITARDDVEITFRTSSLVSSLAEHFIRSDIGRVDFGRVTAVMNAMDPLNVSEDFALCVAARNPTAARDLVLSDLGSTDEADAAQRLAAGVDHCTEPGETLTVDMQALRALASTALYRGVTAVLTQN
jgi:hypothetical protein